MVDKCLRNLSLDLFSDIINSINYEFPTPKFWVPPYCFKNSIKSSYCSYVLELYNTAMSFLELFRNLRSWVEGQHISSRKPTVLHLLESHSFINPHFQQPTAKINGTPSWRSPFLELESWESKRSVSWSPHKPNRQHTHNSRSFSCS